MAPTSKTRQMLDRSRRGTPALDAFWARALGAFASDVENQTTAEASLSTTQPLPRGIGRDPDRLMAAGSSRAALFRCLAGFRGRRQFLLASGRSQFRRALAKPDCLG
jgi:hypothetical protein